MNWETIDNADHVKTGEIVLLARRYSMSENDRITRDGGEAGTWHVWPARWSALLQGWMHTNGAYAWQGSPYHSPTHFGEVGVMPDGERA